ncbi:hypothetical protein BJ170DRAFT_599740 [Xylariales sp. AK1849]|nr:hypothetical protein BJ170DRAFT_599740 [Xylariales sp. AK1849]
MSSQMLCWRGKRYIMCAPAIVMATNLGDLANIGAELGNPRQSFLSWLTPPIQITGNSLNLARKLDFLKPNYPAALPWGNCHPYLPTYLISASSKHEHQIRYTISYSYTQIRSLGDAPSLWCRPWSYCSRRVTDLEHRAEHNQACVRGVSLTDVGNPEFDRNTSGVIQNLLFLLSNPVLLAAESAARQNYPYFGGALYQTGLVLLKWIFDGVGSETSMRDLPYSSENLRLLTYFFSESSSLESLYPLTYLPLSTSPSSVLDRHFSRFLAAPFRGDFDYRFERHRSMHRGIIMTWLDGSLQSLQTFDIFQSHEV